VDTELHIYKVYQKFSLKPRPLPRIFATITVAIVAMVVVY